MYSKVSIVRTGCSRLPEFEKTPARLIETEASKIDFFWDSTSHLMETFEKLRPGHLIEQNAHPSFHW